MKIILSLLLTAILSMALPYTALAKTSYKTYADTDAHIKLRYPSTWNSLTPAESSIPETDYFLKSASGLNQSHIFHFFEFQNPRLMANTNVTGGYVSLAVNKDISDPKQCRQYNLPGSEEALTLKTPTRIGGVRFYTDTAFTTATAGATSTTKIYHGVYKQACYELAMTVEAVSDLNNLPTGTKKLNPSKVISQLKTITPLIRFTK
jgi:hypothetical protein